MELQTLQKSVLVFFLFLIYIKDLISRIVLKNIRNRKLAMLADDTSTINADKKYHISIIFQNELLTHYIEKKISDDLDKSCSVWIRKTT